MSSESQRQTTTTETYNGIPELLHPCNPHRNPRDEPLHHSSHTGITEISYYTEVMRARMAQICHYSTGFAKFSQYTTFTHTGISEINHYAIPRDQLLHQSSPYRNPRVQPLHHSNPHMNPRDQPLKYSNPRKNTRDQADFCHYFNELFTIYFCH